MNDIKINMDIFHEKEKKWALLSIKRSIIRRGKARYKTDHA